MEFSLVGFDVRVWPWVTGLSVEEAEWNVHEEVYEELMVRFSLDENEYQLLEISNTQRLNNICTYLSERHDCSLVAIELPTEIVNAMDKRYGFDTSSIKLDLSGLKPCGLDVCDYDGFFSALRYPQVLPPDTGLLPVSQIKEAYRLVELADRLIPQHSPHTVARISALRQSYNRRRSA